MSKANRLARQDRHQERPRHAPRTTIQHVLDHFQIKKWDYLLLGDGSGSAWGRPIGWACVLIERRSGMRLPFYGACNEGTVNFAELMAYVMPLTYIDTKRVSGKALDVHIITDSEYTQKNSHRLTPDKNAGLIGAIQAFRRKGICTTFHWMRRNTHPITELVDDLSKKARRLVVDHVKDTAVDLNHSINSVKDDDD